MDSNKILNSDYLDILFEGRNKVYGAYELRRNYPKRMMRSMFIIGGIGVVIAAAALVSTLKPNEAPREAITKEVV
ncbi:MAG TPA: energy transducer TonB, partial [Flavipsychrobacter sp.]